MHWYRNRRWIFLLFLAGLLLFIAGLAWLICDHADMACALAAVALMIIGLFFMAFPLFRSGSAFPYPQPYSSPPSYPVSNPSNDPAMPNNPNYPLPSFHFSVEWGGNRIGFSEVSGLTVETEVIEYRVGTNKNYTPTPMPGLKRYGEITLSCAVIEGADELFRFWNESFRFLSGDFKRDITIKLLDDVHNPVIVWKLQDAWARKVSYSELNANTNRLLIESVTLVHEGLFVENL